MPLPWGMAAGLGVLGYIVGFVLLCLKGLDLEGRLKPPQAWGYILLALFSFALWVLGLLMG